MGGYEYGRRTSPVDPIVLVRERLEQEQTELERLGRRITAVQMKIKGHRTRLLKAEAEFVRAQEKLAGIRLNINTTLNIISKAKKDAADSIAAAHAEAARVTIQAEREASMIREAAYEQARVLAEKAYTSGVERARDAAMARTKILGKRSSNRGALQGVAA